MDIKQDLTYAVYKRLTLEQNTHTETESKGIEKHISGKWKQEYPEVAMLISDKPETKKDPAIPLLGIYPKNNPSKEYSKVNPKTYASI